MSAETSQGKLLEALGVTAELLGAELSEAATRILAADLAPYPVPAVLQALHRVRFECRKLTLADIIARIDDGRPGPQEAWAMIPHDEYGSVVWTQEMAEAYGVAAPLLAEGDRIAARMAFIESYTRIIATARSRQEPPSWFPSLGFDPLGREAALSEAVEKGRLPAPHARKLLPNGADVIPQIANQLADRFRLSAPDA